MPQLISLATHLYTVCITAFVTGRSIMGRQMYDTYLLITDLFGSNPIRKEAKFTLHDFAPNAENHSYTSVRSMFIS
jgi:hypothetical protein